ncbi:glycine zipper 2TM domain-containing protein [Noviherbaspirillum cavernae]|uniref:Glycine zipper 2TM domain-containing protein n=1 Tax=Noviherbaspirillum cavernae TaxID=2320862 RepID=A0A418X225_9BURK|nr:glycine zipper 2TM domain-containing protein [Noviherbaspirillum cavernae]RJG06481.1 glycine zipper 2TM domain-containing protein [Noviherbaspirillum cavernae]
MEGNKTTNRIHPLVAGAAVAVMLASLTGVAAMTGLIPNSHSTSAPATTDTVATTPAATTGQQIAAGNPVEPQPQQSSQQNNQAPRATEKSHAPARPAHREPARVAQAPAICQSCGRVESVQAIQQQAEGSGVGIVAGAVLGGVLGNQVGGGNGRKLATVAGAVGGGYAGNEIEKRTRATTSYQVRVRMEDGQLRTFPYSEQPGWSAGDRVRVVNGNLTARA